MYIYSFRSLLALLLIFCFSNCQAQESKEQRIFYGVQARMPFNTDILPGAYSFSDYLPLLKNKRVAILGNQTSEVQGVLLPDTLLALRVNIVKLFSPEHGFRGDADAGAQVNSSKDYKTGLPIISLYGNNKKMTAAQLSDVDVVIYDLQDVGARFYTYISTLEYTMAACAANQKTLIILDRPNPLGHIVDGPILNVSFKSFVGMQPIPIVYGMTPGEYALMLKGENWVKSDNLNLIVIKNKNYTHSTFYKLPVAPSPNLKNMTAIYLYPSLCLFEGTDVSVGRGTETPFQQFGSPNLKGYDYSFVPRPMKGASNPLLNGKTCYGKLVADNPYIANQLTEGKFQIKWLIEAYKNHNNKSKFFNNFFNKLSGNSELKNQIISGWDENRIRASWQNDLEVFKKIRKKYLLYPDFE